MTKKYRLFKACRLFGVMQVSNYRDIKGIFDHMNHQRMVKFLELYIKDPNIIWLVKKFLKAGVMDETCVIRKLKR